MTYVKQMILGCVLFGGLAVSTQAGSVFVTNFEEASAEAKASNKYMLLDFTGSDWCGWCIKLDDEVFSESEFKDYAKENLVCVELDFPSRKKLKKSLRAQNEVLKSKYKITGYPSIILLSPDGETVTRTGYKSGGPEAYVEHLKGYIGPHRKKNNIPEPSVAVAKSSGGGTAALRPLAADANREVRVWTSKKGASVTASILKELGPYVVLRRADGKTSKIVTAMLSDADRAYINDLKRAALVSP